MKKLIIINGVTGAIGSACLALFASQKDTVVYGLSRKAKDFKEFCTDGKLPPKTLICSISEEYPPRLVTYFSDAIEEKVFEEIYYIHAVGIYPFEINRTGDRIVQYDNDCDGVDDRCEYLVGIFNSFCYTLPFRVKKPVQFFSFGSISDKYEPFVHTSSWKTAKKYKEYIIERLAKPEIINTKVSWVNLASVLCPNELISRPFVFTDTDSDPSYWLLPQDIAHFVENLMKTEQAEKFKEYNLFNKLPGFDESYYDNKNFTPRKVKELFGK